MENPESEFSENEGTDLVLYTWFAEGERQRNGRAEEEEMKVKGQVVEHPSKR